MNTTFRLINAQIVNEGEVFHGTVICKDGLIEEVIRTGTGTQSKVPEMFALLTWKGNSSFPG